MEINKVYNIDCIEGMKELPDKSIDFILTDLPYNITAAKFDKTAIPLDKMWEQFNRVVKDEGAIALFGQEPFTSKLVMSNIKNFRFKLTWLKQRGSSFQLANYQPLRVTEDIIVFSNAKACYTRKGVTMTYNPQMIKREKPRKANAKIYGKNRLLHNYNTKDNFKTYDYRHPTSILRFNTVSKNKLHPTEKPIDLLKWLIKSFTNDVNADGSTPIVLDSCAGAGSTLLAAKQLGRNYIGYEIDEHFCNIAEARINEDK